MSQREIIEFLKEKKDWFSAKQLAICMNQGESSITNNLKRMRGKEVAFKLRNNVYIYQLK